jgi:hypothetical protein
VEAKKMKKLLISLSVSLLSLISFAMIPEPSYYVTKDGRLDCKKVTIGMNNARIVFENGNKASVPLSTISSYILDDKEYTKLPIYKNGKPSGQMVFMQLIKSRNDLSLYECVEHDYDSGDPLKTYKKFYVYNGEKLHLELNRESLPSMFAFFGVKWSYE